MSAMVIFWVRQVSEGQMSYIRLLASRVNRVCRSERDVISLAVIATSDATTSQRQQPWAWRLYMTVLMNVASIGVTSSHVVSSNSTQ